jgi:beta-lactamase regulating signal transducer with metallopeptidase domain
MIAYIFKSSLSLIILFGLYWFLLRKEKLFIFNRYFLVLSVVFSLIIPFISIPVSFQATQNLGKIITTFDYNIPEINTSQTNFSEDINKSFDEIQPSGIDISGILVILYISGVILFLIRFLKNIYFVFHRIKLSEKISVEGHRLILTKDQTSPYCFFNNIFIYKDDYLNLISDDHLLNHELVHVRQYHSVDIVFIELIKLFYWFNPLFLLYERAIRINHEYLADHNVIREDCDIKSYADKILSFIVGKSNIPLTSGSNHSFTKKRFLMMTKSGSGSNIYGLRIAMTLCIVMVFFLLMSFEESVEQISTNSTSARETEFTQGVVRGIVLAEDGKPLIGATITTAGSNNTSSKVTTDLDGRFTLNVIQTGASLLIECRGFKGQTLKADFASEMVVKLVRDPDYKGKIIIPVIQTANFRNSDFTPAKALVVIDGVVIDYKGDLKVNPGEIKSFKVLMNKEATNTYGEKGKDGVVEIILYGNKTESQGKNPAVSNRLASDTSKYSTYFSVNRGVNKGELIDIPVSNLQSVSVWTYHSADKNGKKEFRTIGIMTRDFFKVKGRVVRENGKPLSGVLISVSEKPVKATSDKEGRFVIEDVREDALLEFSLSGYKPYYLSTSFGVAFTTELTIKLEKD